MNSDVERIRAWVAEFEQQRRRAIELGNKPELTQAEIHEELELARIVDSGFTLGTVQTLLRIIERQQAVIDAAREMREYISARDVMMMDGSVGDALDKIKRWDDALAAHALDSPPDAQEGG